MTLAEVRRKWPLLDHLLRMYARYQSQAGDRLAAAVTFYWFLSLFPILLIAVFFTNKALGSDAGHQITTGLGPYLGTATAAAVGDVVQHSAGRAGLIGLAGTLLSGLGWIQALREALRTMWHQPALAGNFLVKKVADVVALVGLFAVIGASVGLSVAVTAASDSVLAYLDLARTATADAVTQLLSYLLGAVVDTGVFLYLFGRLAKVRTGLRRVLPGAVLGAGGFEVLKYFAAFYIGRTTSKGEATYGTFAVVVGLLLFLNLVSRLVLYAAAFVVTAPYADDVCPSGTAQGKVEGMEKSWSAKQPRPSAVAVPPAAVADVPGAAKVQLAATVTAAAGGALIAAVGIYGLRTVQGLLRR